MSGSVGGGAVAYSVLQSSSNTSNGITVRCRKRSPPADTRFSLHGGRMGHGHGMGHGVGYGYG